MRERRLTVVQLIPALEAGGAERSTLEIACALVAAGHRSIVVSTGGHMVAQLVREGSEHVEMPIAALVSQRISGKGMARNEWAGMVVILLGVALLLYAHAA